jgi:hypothetical protein
LHKNQDDEDKALADKSADGIGLVDIASNKFLRKIPAGSDPQQVCLSPDGSKIYIANEGVSTATILSAASGKSLHSFRQPRTGRGRRQSGRQIFLCHLRNGRGRSLPQHPSDENLGQKVQRWFPVRRKKCGDGEKNKCASINNCFRCKFTLVATMNRFIFQAGLLST